MIIEKNRGVLVIAFLLFIVFGTTICDANNALPVNGFICTLILIFLLLKKKIKITILDLFLIVLFIYDVISLFFSINFYNSFDHLFHTFIVLEYYFIIRLFFDKDKKIRTLLLTYSTLIFFLAIITVISFKNFSTNVYGAGFDNLYDFKYLHTPMGKLLNIWESILISCFGLICLCQYYYRKNGNISFFCLVICFLIGYNIIQSFSRGAYIALIVAIIAYALYYLLFCSKKNITIKVLVSCLLAVLFISALPNKKEIQRTLQFSETVSQKRSIDGRIKIATAVKYAWDDHILGNGNANFSQAVNQYIYENDNNQFTSFSGNTIFQLIIEKGIIGFFFFLLLLMWMLYSFCREIPHKPKLYIIFTVLLIISIRELSFPTLFEHFGVQLNIITILAIAQNSSKSKEIFLVKSHNKYIALFLIVNLSAFLIVNFFFYSNEQNNHKFIQYMSKNDFVSAENCIAKTSKNTPFLINRSLLYWCIYKENEDTVSLEKSKKYLLEAYQHNPQDPMIKYNLSVIFKLDNNRDMSLRMLRELIKKYPNNSVYQIGLFTQLYEDGKTKESLPYFVSAIKNNPNLLETPMWRNFQTNDSLHANAIVKKLKDDLLCIDRKDPVLSAKYGKILLCLGDTLSAKSFLLSAVSQLPSLTKPWYYMSCIAYAENNIQEGDMFLRKAQFLNLNDIGQKGQLYINDNRNNYPYKFLSEKYLQKFKKWYKNLSDERVVFITEIEYFPKLIEN
jgi:tetratricopeptide (TPR) repeat protein